MMTKVTVQTGRSTVHPMTAAYETAAGFYSAAVTISLRTLRFQQGLITGRSFYDPENTRMVAEKFAAAGEGYAASARAWMRLAEANPLSVMTVARRMSDVLYAPSRPGLKRARENAVRLSRRRKRA